MLQIRGLTFCRTPQMLINMATVGGSSKGGKTVGGFFPEGTAAPQACCCPAWHLALSVQGCVRAFKPLTLLLVTHNSGYHRPVQSPIVVAGLGGKIVSSKGYDVMGNGAADYPKKAKLTYQVTLSNPVLLQLDASQPMATFQTARTSLMCSWAA